MSFHQDYVQTYRSNRSYWEKGVWPSEFDVVIVGAGFTGLYSALYIKKKFPHLRVLVMDRGGMTMGASSRNAGFICFGSPSEILSDIKTMGEDVTMDLIKERYIGTQAIQKIFDDAIDLSFDGGSEVFRAEDEASLQSCLSQLNLVNDIIKRATGLTDCYKEVDPSKFGLKQVEAVLHTQYEGKVDPAKMLMSLTKRVKDSGVEIIHRSAYIGHKLMGNGSLSISTSEGDLVGNHLIFCTNALGVEMEENLDVKPGKNQVYMSNEISHGLKGTYHMNEGYIYFRGVGQRVLIGGGRHLDIENEDPLLYSPEIEAYLMDVLRTHLETNESIMFDHQWVGHIGIGSIKSPIIKRISQNVLVGLRMGGMGVALAPSVGYRLADLLNETLNG